MARDFGKAKGSQTLKDVAAKSNMMADSSMVVKLPIDKLTDNKDNEYLFGMNEKDIEYTARGIQQNGFRGAIEVYDCKDGTYEIYSGHIRTRAMKMIGKTEIPALVYDMPEKETDKRRALLGANLFGRNKIDSSDPVLVARQLDYHTNTLQMEGFSGDLRGQVSCDFGIGGSQVYKYSCLLSLIPELQKLVSEHIVPYSGIYGAKTLSEKEQYSLVEKINSLSEEGKKDITRAETIALMDQVAGRVREIPGQMNVEDIKGVMPETKSESVHREHLQEDTDTKETERIVENPERIFKGSEGISEDIERISADLERLSQEDTHVTVKSNIGNGYKIISKKPDNLSDKMIGQLIKQSFYLHFGEFPDPRKDKKECMEMLIHSGKSYHSTGGLTVDIHCEPTNITVKKERSTVNVTWAQYVNILIDALPELSAADLIEDKLNEIADMMKKAGHEVEYQDEKRTVKSMTLIKEYIEEEMKRIS